MATHRNGKYEPKHLAPRHSKTARALGPSLAPASLALGAVVLAPTAGAAEAPVHVPSLDAGVAASSALLVDPVSAEPVPDGLGGVSVVGPAPVDPAPVDPAPVDPVPAEPVPADPVPGEPVPGEPVPTDPSPADPTGPVPADPVAPEADGSVGPGDPGTSGPTDPAAPDPGLPQEPTEPVRPGVPVAPGTVVDPQVTPVVDVSDGSYSLGEVAPSGSTWVVPDASVPGRYVAVSGYRSGARLAHTGTEAVVLGVAAAVSAAAGGLMVASRRRGRHEA
ncbi:hypothetical protein [Actinomyces faecalis]|uniref:hypothetical protein n=1 Tax=Actinomyces faecalis TaxID=2722820 RepID=UPI00188512D5|nr:hypothetical protein [Actinomyces faecalis]